MADEAVDTESKAAEPATSEAAFDVEKKCAAIMESKLPDAEKARYCAELRGAVKDPLDAERVPFDVYANIKGIKRSVRIGMLAYPKAKGVRAATVSEWDGIFKDF